MHSYRPLLVAKKSIFLIARLISSAFVETFFMNIKDKLKT